MAKLTKEQLLARRLFTAFQSKKSNAVFSQTTGVTYANQAGVTISQTVGMIESESSEIEVKNRGIKSGDYLLKGEFLDFDAIPSPDNTALVYKSIPMSVIGVKNKSDAVIEVHARPK